MRNLKLEIYENGNFALIQNHFDSVKKQKDIINKAIQKKEFEILSDILSDKEFNIIEDRITSPEELKRISRSRAFSRIKKLALSNDFTYFGTITISSVNSDRFNLIECQEKIKKYLKYLNDFNYQKKIPKFKYLIITEKHKNGAFHFHGLFTQEFGVHLTINDNGYDHCEYLLENSGFNSFSRIKDKTAVSYYCLKYLTKNPVQSEFGYYYFASNKLNKPEVQEFYSGLDFTYCFPPEKVFSNEYVTKVEFNLKDLNQEQKLYLMEYFNKNEI